MLWIVLVGAAGSTNSVQQCSAPWRTGTRGEVETGIGERCVEFGGPEGWLRMPSRALGLDQVRILVCTENVIHDVAAVG